MQSKQFYAALKAEVAPAFLALGFKKLGGSVLAFSKSFPERHCTIWFQVDKWGWDQRWGSRFTIEFQTADDPRPGAADITSRQWLGSLLEGHAELEDVRRLNNKVIERLPGFLNCEGQFVMDAGTKIQVVGYSPQQAPYDGDVWLNFYDSEDVQTWGKFFLGRMPRLIEVYETPVLSNLQLARLRFDAALREAQAIAKVREDRVLAIEHLRGFLRDEPEERFRAAAQNIIDAYVQSAI